MDPITLLTAIPSAAVVSVITTYAIRRADRPQAFFVAEPLKLASPRIPTTPVAISLKQEPPDRMLLISNAGDCAAHWLQVEGIRCEAWILVLDEKDPRGGRIDGQRGVVQPGEQLAVITRKSETDPQLKLSWLRVPVRHKRYEQQQVSVENPEEPRPPRGLWRSRPIRQAPQLGD